MFTQTKYWAIILGENLNFKLYRELIVTRPSLAWHFLVEDTFTQLCQAKDGLVTIRKQYMFRFLLLLACSCFCKLQAINSPNALVNGVELCDKPLYDIENHYYGGDLTVVNYNPYSIYASVELVKKVNVRTNVKNDIIVVGPYDKSYIGRVQQADFNKGWSYHAQLYAIPVD